MTELGIAFFFRGVNWNAGQHAAVTCKHVHQSPCTQIGHGCE